MTAGDDTMTRITAAIELGRKGQKADARDLLDAIWAEVGPEGDPFHRCVLAHYQADLQDSTADELLWDQRALDAVAGLTDARAQAYDASLQVQGFLPSLHLNLADDYRRLGNSDLARQHLTTARALIDQLPEGPYRGVVQSGLSHVADALDAGSTEALPTAH